jgi:2-C-methyl-D-erythritol 2,4-cyclodiphosphate synthase
VLGGVEIAFEKGLLGHSDSDALAHALCDALLGAASLGDIGRHFPPSDPQYRDASSLDLLSRVARLVDDAGFLVANIDATILAESPRLAPSIERMRERIASALGIDPDRVSVKAKTGEGLDAVGRGEAIAAHAVALLYAK